MGPLMMLTLLPGPPPDPSTDCSLRSTRCSGLLKVGLLISPPTCRIGYRELRVKPFLRSPLDCSSLDQPWSEHRACLWRSLACLAGCVVCFLCRHRGGLSGMVCWGSTRLSMEYRGRHTRGPQHIQLRAQSSSSSHCQRASLTRMHVFPTRTGDEYL